MSLRRFALICALPAMLAAPAAAEPTVDLEFGPNYYPRAHDLYSRTCHGGDMDGCHRLGVLHAYGLGVAQDLARAYELYSRACDSGINAACDNLRRLPQTE